MSDGDGGDALRWAPIEMTVGKWRRSVVIRPGYDQRPNYGYHGMHLSLIVQLPVPVPEFAVEWIANLDIVPVTVKEKWSAIGCSCEAYGWDLTDHSMYDLWEETLPAGNCRLLAERTCYASSSGVEADEYFRLFANFGPEPIWALLESRAEKLENQVRLAKENISRFS